MKSLSIVMCVYNKWNFTKSALTDLLKMDNVREIIVIDNNSTDETSVEITHFLSNSKTHILYIQNKENTFHSKACNKGFRMTTGDVVLFLNNDIRVRSNHDKWHNTLIDASYATNGVVGPTMGLLDKDLNFVKESNTQLTGNSYLSGWCIAATKEVWKKIDMNGTGQVWNEDFPFYFNDTDMSFRCREKKISQTVIAVPDIVHFGKVSAAQVNIHKLYTDGRKVFLEKWGKK